MSNATYPTNEEIQNMRLPELRSLFKKVMGKETKSPNRKYLTRTIVAAIATRPKRGSRSGGGRSGAPAAVTPPRSAGASATSAAATPAAVVGVSSPPAAGAAESRGSFAGMTVRQLQEKYLAVVGRPTGSHDHDYLVWKIREAQKGHVRVGPRRLREPKDIQTIPVCMDRTGVAMMDATWRATGFKSRTQFLNRAVGKLLSSLGANEAAAHFGGTAEASA